MGGGEAAIPTMTFRDRVNIFFQNWLKFAKSATKKILAKTYPYKIILKVNDYIFSLLVEDIPENIPNKENCKR